MKNISVRDKVVELYEIRNKMVLCQQHEIERLYQVKHKTIHIGNETYINGLYQHYIVEGKGKTYLNN